MSVRVWLQPLLVVWPENPDAKQRELWLRDTVVLAGESAYRPRG